MACCPRPRPARASDGDGRKLAWLPGAPLLPPCGPGTQVWALSTCLLLHRKHASLVTCALPHQVAGGLSLGRGSQSGVTGVRWRVGGCAGQGSRAQPPALGGDGGWPVWRMAGRGPTDSRSLREDAVLSGGPTGGGCKALIGCLLGEGGEAAAVGGACRLALGPSLLGPILGAAWGRLRSWGLWDLTGLTHGQEPARPRGCPPAESRGDPASSFTRMGGPLPAPSKRSEHLSPPDVSSVVEKSCHIVRRGRAGVPPRRRD